MPFQLETPFFSNASADILNQATLGTVLFTIPAGSFCDVSILMQDQPDEPGELVVTAGFNNVGAMGEIARWYYQSGSTPGSGLMSELFAANIAMVPIITSTPRTFRPGFDAALCLLFVPDAADPTFFQGQAVIKIYS